MLSRRRLLQLGAFATALGPRLRDLQADDGPPPKRQLLACSSDVLSDYPDHLLLRYLLSLTGKPEPVVYFLATAEGDNPEDIVEWYEAANSLSCRPRHLRLFGPIATETDFSVQLLTADAIFVLGGNTMNMLAVWRAQEIDAILRTAWERGVVIAGESAGMNCWFEQALSDSRPERMTAIDGLGWFRGSACPHYDEPGRRPAYHRLVAARELPGGLACDDGAAILFEGERLAKVVTTSKTAGAYRVRLVDNRVVEEKLAAELLTKPS
jgi:peptidase E